MYVYIHIHTSKSIYTYIHKYVSYIYTPHPVRSRAARYGLSHTQWPRRYGACPMGTSGKPPDCAQCETGYVPPRLLGALPNRD